MRTVVGPVIINVVGTVVMQCSHNVVYVEGRCPLLVQVPTVVL